LLSASGASRTFVVTDEGGRVHGYYAMVAGAVSHQLATSGVRSNMPDPVPAMVLARLAVDRRAQGLHLGAALLRDAVNRAVAVSQNAGVRALLVHALHEKARQFYANTTGFSGIGRRRGNLAVVASVQQRDGCYWAFVLKRRFNRKAGNNAVH